MDKIHENVFLTINTDIYLNILKNLFNKKIMINLFKSLIKPERKMPSNRIKSKIN